MPDKRTKTAASDSDQEPSKKPRKENENNPLSFDPVHFIRSHSKNNDPADIQTQVSSSISLNIYIKFFTRILLFLYILL